jgi:Tol biopolymer transport system component
MTSANFLYLLFIFATIASGCTIEINQTEAVPVQESTPSPVSTSAFPVTHIPVSWAHLNLTGKVVYLKSTMEGDTILSNIQMLDLATGDVATIFSVPGAWIYYATISPDAKLMVMSYAPPRQSNSLSSRILYGMPLDGTVEPRPLFTPPTPADRYTQAEWSMDGKYLYYVHYNQDDKPEGQFYEDYEIFRMTYPGGEHEKIVEHAFWPRVSSDSSKLVYVSIDPASGLNQLFLADADGKNVQRVPGIPEIIDAPIFSPDGQSILYSTPSSSQSYLPSWFEKLLGIQVAKAHNVPSDWWSVPIAGGAPRQLTNIQTINLFASLSPDGRRIVSLSGSGLFVMDLDGSNLTQLVTDAGLHGTVSWIP